MFDRLKDEKNSPDLSARLIQMLDVTSLNGDDTSAKIEAIVENVVRTFESWGVCPAAICVYPVFLGQVRKGLGSAPVKLATVAAGFPHGLSPLAVRINEIRASHSEGADEIDVVIRRSHALEEHWQDLEAEVTAFRQAASDACLKVILEVGELDNGACIRNAALACMRAGADFIKTSTGKTPLPPTIAQGAAVLRALKEFETTRQVGFKAAGGIKAVEQALEWITVVEKILGPECLKPELFRIGASSLFDVMRGNFEGRSRQEGVNFST